MRTGAMKALTYGQGVTGVANTTLLAQRRAVAAAVAPAAGTRGQCLDMTLALADGKAKGRADPAFDAHIDPIGQWAQAVWHEWLPRKALVRACKWPDDKVVMSKEEEDIESEEELDGYSYEDNKEEEEEEM